MRIGILQGAVVGRPFARWWIWAERRGDRYPFRLPRGIWRRLLGAGCGTGSAALLLAGLLTLPAAARAAQAGAQKAWPIRVTPSPQVFATLCAVYAAGYPVAPSGVSPELQDMVARLGALQGPAVTQLREFYKSHRLSTDSDTFASFLSFAMVVGPPPSFHYTLPIDQLPPDVRNLSGFRAILTAFYQQARIGDLWNQVEPSYQAEAMRLQAPVSELVAKAAGYARWNSPYFGDRTFSIYVDPLTGLQTNFRIYSESYAIAVNPAASGAMNEIRLAFLHFLLDPLPFNNLAIVESKAFLLNFAAHAPRLPGIYKQQFVAFTAECLVRAVDLHLRALSPAALDAALSRDDRDGYILVRPLYTGLAGYESSDGTLQDYFPKLIGSINLKAEAARDQKIAFAPAEAPSPSPPAPQEGIIAQWLDTGNKQIASQNGQAAAATFARVLQIDPKNTRAQYGLAVASVMTGQGERAHQLFEQVVQSPAAGPPILAWSHVYLGRMNDLAGRRQNALAEYRAALGVSGAPTAAHAAAEQGIQTPFAVERADPGTTPHR